MEKLGCKGKVMAGIIVGSKVVEIDDEKYLVLETEDGTFYKIAEVAEIETNSSFVTKEDTEIIQAYYNNE